VRLDAVEEQVHEREPARSRHEVLAVINFLADEIIRAIEHAAGDGLGDEPFPRADEEAARAAGGIADAEVGLAARVGLHDAADGLDERARGEVLARAFLAFAGGLFEQTFERRPLHVHVHRRPILLVNHGDDALEVDRIVEARRGLRKDVAEDAGLLAKFAEDVGVMIGQRRAGFVLEAGPIEFLRHLRPAFLGHLEEQQVGELFDVIAVIHAVMALRVAKAPEFLDDVGH
jgi:hypothetical protein